MFKFILKPDSRTPTVYTPSGYVFENARGGPYKYGEPIEFNREAAKRLREGTL